jgi:putative ATP-dependent endonuclease of the OLD family
MKDGGIRFKGYRCFEDWAGFDEIKPVNIVIGRNNSGKSTLMKLVEFVAKKSGWGNDSKIRFAFQTSISKNHVTELCKQTPNAKHFENMPVYFERVGNSPPSEVKRTEDVDLKPVTPVNLSQVQHICKEHATKWSHPILNNNTTMRSVSFSRDIVPESEVASLTVGSDGKGVTNLISRFIHDSAIPRDIIQDDLLRELNNIVDPDTYFSEIITMKHAHPDERWEIYLGDPGDRLIKLSDSGSGLKTIILILVNLYILRYINVDNKNTGRFMSEPSSMDGQVFIIEEYENCMHPAMQRRLLKYIEDYAVQHNSTFFLTTHSHVALDVFATSPHAQIVRVVHDDVSSTTQTIVSFSDKHELLRDLGVRPSDILQANGIVWLEGPSDRIYFNKWLELVADGALQEGRDYQCAFYGGSVLAKLEAVDPSEGSEDKINIFNINANAVFLCDSDRTTARGKGSELKNRVKSIVKNLEQKDNCHVWVTEAKEIENYIPVAVLRTVWSKKKLPEIGKHKKFWGEKGYFTTYSPTKTVDKVKLAQDVVGGMDLEAMKAKYDWHDQMQKIVVIIAEWNGKVLQT